MTTFTGSARRDRLFALVWAGFAFTSFLVDAQVALGVDLAARNTAFDRALIDYGATVDRVFLSGSDTARTALFFSAFLFGPLKLALAAALWRRATRFRQASLVFCGGYAYSTLLWMAVGLFGANPSPRPLVYVLSNGPYLVVPLLFAALVMRSARAGDA